MNEGLVNQEGYFFDKIEGIGSCIVLTGPWNDSYFQVIKENNISALRLSQGAGWQQDDLSFVRSLKGYLKGLDIYSWKVADLQPVQELRDLEHLAIQCDCKHGLNFLEFERLKQCFVHWNKRYENLFSCTQLKSLNVTGYPFEDLKAVAGMSKLQRLLIVSSKLQSLSGVEGLSSLEELNLYRCTKLSDLSDIRWLNQLTRLIIQSCKKFPDIELPPNLLELSLEDCGRIESIRSLVNCKNIEHVRFVGDTIISDGDLSVLLQLPKLSKTAFANRRHYSHSFDEIKQLIARGREVVEVGVGPR